MKSCLVLLSYSHRYVLLLSLPVLHHCCISKIETQPCSLLSCSLASACPPPAQIGQCPSLLRNLTGCLGQAKLCSQCSVRSLGLGKIGLFKVASRGPVFHIEECRKRAHESSQRRLAVLCWWSPPEALEEVSIAALITRW